MRVWTIMMVAALWALSGCVQPVECDSDDDCAEGYVCSRGSTGYIEASVCTQPLEGQVLQGCRHECPAGIPGEAICTEDGVTVCFLSCPLENGDGGLASCDDDLQNGCETDTSSDAGNCGGCGVACAESFTSQNVTGSCMGGACVPDACVEGYVDLDDDVLDGCDVAWEEPPAIDVSKRDVLEVVRAVGQTAVVRASEVLFIADTDEEAEGLQSFSLTSTVDDVRGIHSTQAFRGVIAMMEPSGASIGVFTADGQWFPEVDTIAGVSALDITPSSDGESGAEIYPFDLVTIEGDALRWYAYINNTQEPVSLFAGDAAFWEGRCESLGVTALPGGLNRCLIAEVTLASTGAELVRWIRLSDSQPLILTYVDGAPMVFVLDPTGALEPKRLAQLEVSGAVLERPSEVELWTDASGEDIGVVWTLEGSAPTVLFLVVDPGPRDVELVAQATRELPPGGSISDLVAYGLGRYLLTRSTGLFMVSGERDEPSVLELSPDTGWDAGGQHGGTIALWKLDSLLRLPELR